MRHIEILGSRGSNKPYASVDPTGGRYAAR